MPLLFLSSTTTSSPSFSFPNVTEGALEGSNDGAMGGSPESAKEVVDDPMSPASRDALIGLAAKRANKNEQPVEVFMAQQKWREARGKE